jgi:dCTP deaminase
MSNHWAEITPGTLVDEDIVHLADAGQLITSGFDPERVRQACYELRASEVFYDLRSGDPHTRIVVGGGEPFILKPPCYVTAIVVESIELPPNVLGRILTKGQ